MSFLIELIGTFVAFVAIRILWATFELEPKIDELGSTIRSAAAEVIA